MCVDSDVDWGLGLLVWDVGGDDLFGVVDDCFSFSPVVAPVDCVSAGKGVIRDGNRHLGFSGRLARFFLCHILICGGILGTGTGLVICPKGGGLVYHSTTYAYGGGQLVGRCSHTAGSGGSSNVVSLVLVWPFY